MLHDRGRADHQIRVQPVGRRQIIRKRGAEFHHDAARFQPITIMGRPARRGASGADIGHICPAFDQQAGNNQFRHFITLQSDPALDGRFGQRAAHGRDKSVLRRCNLRGGDAICVANRGQPVMRAVHAHRGRTHNGAARRFKFTHGGGIERVNRCDHAAIERGI